MSLTGTAPAIARSPGPPIPTGPRPRGVNAVSSRASTGTFRASVRLGRTARVSRGRGRADAVFVGQAFHWFDVARALPEIARVLRPGGGLAAMWNIGQPQGDAWRTEVLELVREIDMDPERRRVLSQAGAEETAWQHGGEWELFEPLERREFEHTQRMTADEYVTFVSSWSFVAIIEEPQRTELLTAVAGVLDRHQA